MRKIIYFVLLLVSSLTFRTTAFDYFPSFCHFKATELTHSGPECLVSNLQHGKDCDNRRFENMGYSSPTGESLGKFRLSAYIHHFNDTPLISTAFNLSISGVKFTELYTRYQELSNEGPAACRNIDIYGNDGKATFPDMFISCPFSGDTYEGIPYRLEYLVVGKSFRYSRRLVFKVPRHISIDTNDVKTFVPFFYVDFSNNARLALHIQPLPDKFNVTMYKVWLINNETNSVEIVDVKLSTEPEIQHNFSVGEGVHYFKVAAMHPNCDEYGCANSTSPMINNKRTPRRLLIMIISVVWIPPLIFYIMYQAYKFYMKKMLRDRRQRRMNCLLVYSPTHWAHVDVMEKLALYMRSCNINAMIDMLSIPETVNKDPGLWCNSAFQNADVIVVATSPPPSDVVVPVIYQNMDNHALRLLKENYSRRNKSYFAVQFPYCKRDEIPEEARLFRRFEMPQELDSLVRNIYHVDRIRLFGVSSKEFVQSIKVAVAEIPQGKSNESKIPDKTDHNIETHFSDELLPPSIKHNIIKLEEDKSKELKSVPESDVGRQCFTTNIDELNLLGDNGEAETFIYTPQQNDAEFRIDRLNL